MVRIGAHVGWADPLAEAAARQVDLVQFFLGDPQGWKGPVVDYPGGANALRAAAADAGVTLYVHAPYVINVATPNNRVRIPSRKLLQQTVDAAAEIGAKAVIVHGGHAAGVEPEVGLDNWRKALQRLEIRCPVLIENTAGGANAMARKLTAIARLWEALHARCDMTKVGLCLDTCHAHAGGEDLDGLADRVKAITGRIDLVHANDSKDASGSGRDRHQNLGYGQIDPQLLVDVVAAAGAPVICETPGEADSQTRDITWLRNQLSQ